MSKTKMHTESIENIIDHFVCEIEGITKNFEHNQAITECIEELVELVQKKAEEDDDEDDNIEPEEPWDMIDERYEPEITERGALRL